MSEQIKLGGNIFGYDTLIKAGEDFIALQGNGAPELYNGMKVVLLGDSRGYVPSGFKPGDEVTILGFREAFKHGESDHIVQVTNGRNTGWVKPSNIQKNLVEAEPVDPVYRKIRQAVHSAFTDFMDTVYLHMTDEERKNLPSDTMPFVNATVSYALQRLPEFGEHLAETIARVYDESPSGERFIQDPINSTMIARAYLFLDQDGHIITVKNPEIVRSPSSPSYLYMKRCESYKVLTGPSAGRRFNPNTRPLGNPVYHPGIVSGHVDSGVPQDSTYNVETSNPMADSGKEIALRNQILISYSHKDKKWLERLQVHLKPLERLGAVTRWDDSLIKPGSKWREEISQAIRSAKVAVLLVSADFLASDFIANNELPPLLAAAEANGAVVLPVIVSPCLFDQTKSLSQFQSVNSPSKPLVSLNKAQQEAVFVKVVKAIESGLRS